MDLLYKEIMSVLDEMGEESVILINPPPPQDLMYESILWIYVIHEVGKAPFQKTQKTMLKTKLEALKLREMPWRICKFKKRFANQPNSRKPGLLIFWGKECTKYDAPFLLNNSALCW